MWELAIQLQKNMNWIQLRQFRLFEPLMLETSEPEQFMTHAIIFQPK